MRRLLAITGEQLNGSPHRRPLAGGGLSMNDSAQARMPEGGERRAIAAIFLAGPHTIGGGLPSALAASAGSHSHTWQA
jgi:hypothetical protein